MNVSHAPDRPGYDALWESFGLSRAAWLVLPRVLLHEMPDEWQLRLANLLNEMEDTFPGAPCFDYAVVAKDTGKFARLPEVLCNYRHPDLESIDRMRSIQSETEVTAPTRNAGNKNEEYNK